MPKDTITELEKLTFWDRLTDIEKLKLAVFINSLYSDIVKKIRAMNDLTINHDSDYFTGKSAAYDDVLKLLSPSSDNKQDNEVS